MIGFVNIYKPLEISSARAVSKFKKKMKCKCGHMGTLDPLASGVLPIGINQANRLFEFLLDKEKTYEAIFDFAFSTATLDLEGEPIKHAKYLPKIEEIQAILPKFIGKISQVPPDYSAKLINGQRSYNLARAGVKVDLQPKVVEILDIKILEQLSESQFAFEINCKGGTYIRSLARDFGNEFSCAATMVKLERTKCGIFTKENSVLIEEFLDSDDISKFIIPTDSAVNFEKINLDNQQSTRLLNGVYDDFEIADGLYRVYAEGEFWGVGVALDKKIKMKAFVRDL